MAPISYSEWGPFWSAFSQAAAIGDAATVAALTADELSFVYAGGSVTSWTGPKDDILGSFNRRQEVFEPGRQTLDSGAAFSADLRPPDGSSTFDHFGVPYDMLYSIFIEESEGGPASSTEYIFRKVEGRFLLVGYGVDS